MQPWEAKARWSQVIVVAIGVALFVAAYALAAHRTTELTELLRDGQIAVATVTEVSERNADRFTSYRYVVNGSSLSGSASYGAAPHSPGETFSLRYLSRNPSLNWPEGHLDGARIEREVRPVRIGGFVLFAIFVLPALMGELRIRRRARGNSAPLFTVEQIGRALAVLLTVVTIGANRFDDVHRVQERAFGVRPFGIPVTWVVSAIELVLVLPALWVMTTHLMRILLAAMRDGASIRGVGFAIYLVRSGTLHPTLRRSRAIVLAGAAYFFILMGSWIAFAASRGI